MTPAELLALANRLLYACRDPVTGEPLYAGVSADACVEDVDAAARYLRACAETEPVAYRVEYKLAAPTLDQSWRKYADYGTRKEAESSRPRFAAPAGIQRRIVPLYAGKPEEPR